MRLDEEKLAIRASVKRVAAERLAPFAEEWDADGECPASVIRELAELGYLGLQVAGAHGGSDCGYLSYAVVMEELAAGCAGVSTIVHVHNFVALAVSEMGTPLQHQEYLSQMTAGDLIGAFCLTEPRGGSDTAMIETTAVRVDAGWRLNGEKCFITNGRRAGLAVVIAVTDPSAGRSGITAFLVPTSTPGFSVERVEKKLGQRCSDTAAIRLQDCVVPASAILGGVGQSYAYTMSSLAAGRVSVAAQAVGIAQAAFDLAVSYAQQREAFGKAIANHQAIGFRLADMRMQIELARQYTWHAAQLLDDGVPCTAEASIAKCFAAEMAERVCSDAISIHGGLGYVCGSGVERLYRDVRACQIYEGTSDMQRLIVARDILKAGHVRHAS